MASYVLWEGLSLLDGAPIVVLATGIDTPSANKKTGPLVQTYILRKDLRPLDAHKQGRDSSICGDCTHRLNKTCYVDIGRAPTQIYRSYAAGRCVSLRPEALPVIGIGRKIRIGAYGDPAAVPLWVWRKLTQHAEGYTGYTHQWQTCDPAYARYCMASVDTPFEALQAKVAGWRTFRVKAADQPSTKHEAQCPAAIEAGNKLQCTQCMACDGTHTGRRGDIVTNVHGLAWKQRRFAQAA